MCTTSAIRKHLAQLPFKTVNLLASCRQARNLPFVIAIPADREGSVQLASDELRWCHLGVKKIGFLMTNVADKFQRIMVIVWLDPILGATGYNRHTGQNKDVTMAINSSPLPTYNFVSTQAHDGTQVPVVDRSSHWAGDEAPLSCKEQCHTALKSLRWRQVSANLLELVLKPFQEHLYIITSGSDPSDS